MTSVVKDVLRDGTNLQAPNFHTQEDFFSSGHQSVRSRPSTGRPSLVFSAARRSMRNFETPVGPVLASSQGSCTTVVPDTPDASQGVNMGEMDRLSQVLDRVELSGDPALQHHLAEILSLMRTGS